MNSDSKKEVRGRVDSGKDLLTKLLIKYRGIVTETLNLFEQEAPDLKSLFKELEVSLDYGGGMITTTNFIKADKFHEINKRIGTLSSHLQDMWNKVKAINASKDPMFGDMIKTVVNNKKANVGFSLSGRAITSPAAACASASSQPFSLDYKQLAKEVVSQMGSVTAEMSGKMAKEVTARLEKHWGPGNVGDSDDGELVGSDADCVDDDDDNAPGAGGGGSFALPPCTSKQRSSNYERTLATLIELFQLAKFLEKYMPQSTRS